MKRIAPLDGLRGLAILLVIIYHTTQGPGHMGVDIFFTLSGFVLTLSLYNTTNPLAFFNRRLWRLVPAIFFLCTVITLSLPFLFNSYAFPTFERLLQTILFVSAYTDAQKPDYFLTQNTDIFAHAWSLSVEMTLSALMAVGLLIPRHWLKKIIPLLTLISFILFVTPLWSFTERFHLFPFRFWEFGLGIIAAYFYQHKQSISVSFPGWLVLLISLPIASTSLILSSTAAAIGTLLLLIAPWPKWLSFSPLVKTGQISYGLYLWHWPLILIGQAAGLPMPLILSITLLMATLSWHLVEKPLKSGKPFLQTMQIFAFSTLALLFVSFTSLSLIPQKQPRQDKTFVTCHLDLNAPAKPSCLDPNPDILLWGDSHAGVLAGALKTYANKTNQTISILTRNGCPPVGPSLTAFWPQWPGQNTEKSLCKQTQIIGLDEMKKAKTIIITLHWTRQFKTQNCPDCQLQNDLKSLFATLPDNKKIIILGPTPEPGYPVFFWRDVRDPFNIPLPIIPKNTVKTNTKIAFDWLNDNHIPFIDLFPILCPDEQCTYKTSDGLLYFDSDHLTHLGAKTIIESIFKTQQP